MALDRDYYARFDPQSDLPRLHIYTWQGPCLSLGRYQELPPPLEERARQQGVDRVKRPTGGQGILHLQDLTWSVTAPLSGTRSVLESYRILAALHIEALQALGVHSQMGESARPYRHHSSCFEVLNAGDISVLQGAQKRKLIGAAQLRRRGAYLQQQMIYLRHPGTLLERLFGQAPDFVALEDCLSTREMNGARRGEEFSPAIETALKELNFHPLAPPLARALIWVYSRYWDSAPELVRTA